MSSQCGRRSLVLGDTTEDDRPNFRLATKNMSHQFGPPCCLGSDGWAQAPAPPPHSADRTFLDRADWITFIGAINVQHSLTSSAHTRNHRTVRQPHRARSSTRRSRRVASENRGSSTQARAQRQPLETLIVSSSMGAPSPRYGNQADLERQLPVCSSRVRSSEDLTESSSCNLGRSAAEGLNQTGRGPQYGPRSGILALQSRNHRFNIGGIILADLRYI